MINYDFVLYATTGMLVSQVVIQIAWIVARKTPAMKKKTTKKTLPWISWTRYAVVGLWLTLLVIGFVFNPIEHYSEHDGINNGVVVGENAVQSETDMDSIKRLSDKEVLRKGSKSSDELSGADKESSDSYNEFLKSIEVK